MKTNWIEEEDNFILENYNKMTWKEMSKFLGCAIQTVQKRAERLGVEIIYNNRSNWTEEEINLLREYADKYVTKNIAKMLNRSTKSVKKKALKEGIKLHSYNDPFKKWMIDYIMDNYKDKSQREIAEFIGLSLHRVRKKYEELELDYDNKRWTEEELNILLKYHDKCHYSELTKLLPDKTKGAILTKARKMNIDIITDKIKYNEEHKLFIKNNWGKMSINEMCRRLGITRRNVYSYQKELGLPDIGIRKKWTEDKIEKLREKAKTMRIEELAKYFSTTKRSISTVAYKNNIQLIDSKIIWTEEKVNQLKEVADKYNASQLCIMFDSNLFTIKRIAEKYNIKIKYNDTNNPWTEEEITLLKELTKERVTVSNIMKYINKTDYSVKAKCKELGLYYIDFERKEWTEDELNNIIEDAKVLNINELVVKYNRSAYSIRMKLRKENIKVIGNIDYWSEEDVSLLKQLISEDKEINYIAKTLNRTVSATVNKIKTENIDFKYKRMWTKEEEDVLEELWNEHNKAYFAKRFNRSISAIENKAYSMGLSKQFIHQDSIKIEEIAELFNVSRTEVDTTWIILGLPYRVENVSSNMNYKYVRIDDLFAFLENNQFLYDGKDFEENILGIEPDWVKKKRKHDTFYGFEYDRVSLIKKKLLQQKKYYLELEKEKINKEKVLKKQI